MARLAPSTVYLSVLYIFSSSAINSLKTSRSYFFAIEGTSSTSSLCSIMYNIKSCSVQQYQRYLLDALSKLVKHS